MCCGLDLVASRPATTPRVDVIPSKAPKIASLASDALSPRKFLARPGSAEVRPSAVPAPSAGR
jgi:hypothetical protein